MATNVGTFEPLVGAKLDFFSISSATLTLGLLGNNRETYELSTMADVCWAEDKLFEPFSDDLIADPAGLSSLYESVGEKVISFAPLERKRACRLAFETSHMFVWAREDGLPDCLFTARQSVSGELKDWWLIDD